MRDPRPYQIATLALLLGYGLTRLGFDVPAAHVVLILSTALLTQRVLTDAFGLPRFDPRSALISGLSLCLLLRTDSPWLAAAAAVAAIASKFVIRGNGKHLFNLDQAGAKGDRLIRLDTATKKPDGEVVLPGRGNQQILPRHRRPTGP